MKSMEYYLSIAMGKTPPPIPHPEKNTLLSPEEELPPDGSIFHTDAREYPEDKGDEFKKAFLSIYAKATDTFHIWAVSAHKKTIHKALSELDDAWSRIDYPSLQRACEAIERLILKAWADDYSKRKEAVRIYSEVVGDYVYLVSNESVLSHMKAEGLVCYTPEEIIHMGKLSAEEVKAIHCVKKQFGGDTRIVS